MVRTLVQPLRPATNACALPAAHRRWCSYDPERAQQAPEEGAEAPRGRPAGMWMVLTVALRAKQEVTVARLEEGTVSAEMTDYRPQNWRFATGPLPGGLPVRRLETPWFLVSV
jgi:hypothetical protein